MSISQIQKQMVIEEVARHYFSSGTRPRPIDVMKDVSAFFSKNPIGRPFEIAPNNMQTGLVSNVDEMNDAFLRALINVSILYESFMQDTERSMDLYTVARTRLDNLRARRDEIESTIDDYLLSLSNTAGYFYSFSDVFSTLTNTDLTYTSAFVDVASNTVSIPSVAAFTRVLPFEAFTVNSTTMTIDGRETSFQTDSPFDGAVDGLSNTNWAFSMVSDTISEVVVETRIDLAEFAGSPDISRVEIDPFTITPMQIFVETVDTRKETGSSSIKTLFGDTIKSGLNKMTFVDSVTPASAIYITMRKTEPDYEIQQGKTTKYVYIFGASHLSVAKQSYDNTAKFVSTAIALPDEIASDHVIDSVALSVKESVPAGTSIDYFIAPDNEDATVLNDFNWQVVDPTVASDLD